jgi:hypothetical protein
MKKVYPPIKVEQLGNLAELTQGRLGGYGDAQGTMSMNVMMTMVS